MTDARRDIVLLFATRFARMFAYGLLSIVLVLYLTRSGFDEKTIGHTRTIGFECTIAVDSIDATEKAVLAAGGKIVLARSVITGVGTLMFFQDSEGNIFGAMQYDSRAA